MSKHQHGNREAKKPKREPLPAQVPVSGLPGTPERAASPGPRTLKRK